MKQYKRWLTRGIAPVVIMFALSQPALAAAIDLSLDDSIDLALKNNPSIKTALTSREQSYWALEQAKAGKGLTLGYTHTDERYTTYSSYKVASDRSLYYDPYYLGINYYDNSLSLKYPLYTGGSVEGQIDEAKLSLKVSDLSIEATKQQLKQTVTNDYFNVLQYRNNLAVSRESVDNYTSHLKNVELQYSAGIVAKTDVLSSQVSLANAQASLIKAQNNYDLAVATLNNAIGLSLDTEVNIKEDLKYDSYTMSLADCTKYALANRPEMAQYQAKIDSAKAGVKVAQSGHRPTVNLFATEDWHDSEFAGLDNNNWAVGLTATWSILDAGLTDSKIKQADYGVKTAEVNASQKRDSIMLEVRQYYLSLREAEKRIETTQVAVNQAQENLKIAEVRYGSGVGTNLDVLDAVLALNQAKTNYIQALYDYNTSKASLAMAMGIAVK
ncbi:MAG: tolC 2 [Firmicutes bacterium]|nr:tolC 2 [Bacillota bacterium]